MAKEITKLTDVYPQQVNANDHKPRGMGLLEKSIQKDGWIGAITVANNGDTFDGSARVEVGVPLGFEDVILIESDGSKPILHRRIDIPSGNDPRARRLGLAANRVAELNLQWNAAIVAGQEEEVRERLWSKEEFAQILKTATPVEETVSPDQTEAITERFNILIECKNEQEQTELLQQLTTEGYSCRALIS